jgi:hypothetical protein
MYLSLDNGEHWQSFQLNLPALPITDMKVHRKDLVLSTQGRGFWIVDNLTPLHQATAQVASAPAKLYRPREAYRMRYAAGGGFGRGRGPAAPQYPQPGAMIDFNLGASSGPVTLDILDAGGRVVRSVSSEGGAGTEAVASGGDEEDEAPRRARPAPRLTKTPGLNRFVWDLSYPGPRDPATGQPGTGGPTAVPGTYQVRLTAGGFTETQPLVLREDPRIAKDGVTLADLRDQFEHNMRVRDLVSDVNRAVYRVREARTRLRDGSGTAGDTLQRVRAIEAKLVTPSIRYSKPELQAHITYLYSLTTQADQRVGRDAKERYAELRKELDTIVAQLNQLLGPERSTAAASR